MGFAMRTENVARTISNGIPRPGDVSLQPGSGDRKLAFLLPATPKMRSYYTSRNRLLHADFSQRELVKIGFRQRVFLQ